MKTYGTNTGIIFNKDSNGSIYIYSNTPLLKSAIHTSNDNITWKILKLLRTPKTFIEIKKHFNIEQQSLIKIIKVLLEKELLVEDPLKNDDKWFRLERFINALPQKKYKKYRDKIENINILILGLGTAGSYSLELLSKIGLKNFILVDNDKVEEKNIISQNYRKKDIGNSKIESLRERYESCNIICIKKNIETYQDIKKIIKKYSPKYFLSDADDSSLVIQILKNIFKEFPSIKIIESGYNPLLAQTELISLENYKYYLQKFVSVEKTFLIKNKFNGIADNSGIIFHAISDAFFASKIIFDDITKIASSNFGEFNFLENKYFLDNTYYIDDFKKYTNRYIHDNNFVCPSVHIKDKNIALQKIEKLNNKSKIFVYSKTRWNIFKYFLNLNVPEEKIFSDNENLNKYLIEFCSKEFNKSIFKPKDMFNNNLFIPRHSYAVKRSYTELLTNGNTRIYMNNNVESKEIEFIHEYMHTIAFKVTKDQFTHEKFVLEYMIQFILYLKEKNIKLFNYIGKKLIKYIQGNYLDLFTILEKEKMDYLNDNKTFYKEMNKYGLNLSYKKLSRIIKKYTSNKKIFYYLKYTIPIKDNFYDIRKLVNELNI
ncbi:ThiF family adenylyltransferase [Apilactobacillus timberlakei]|uniref:THIF-type NAD/FAD binding fold domain-containing protein n=1 Tax=Apilactobacillus timberlakei TaxID=2008380 RepID=A0ABY2YRC3_9LACO|nr:ThiF family adenylyltransferase [Apilactobacillus timberlakei]TPR12289.1 hypothetical protein DY048_07785 [Apilactobacillus timberlakei]TPR12823.1 hypothetical protein DY052_09080 [Apilactobacillus timberlakei]